MTVVRFIRRFCVGIGVIIVFVGWIVHEYLAVVLAVIIFILTIVSYIMEQRELKE